MTYALVDNDLVVRVGFPPNGVWNDGSRDWDVANMSQSDLAAIGWLPVVETPKPPATDTTTHDLTYQVVSGQPTQVWLERPKTPEELQAEQEAENAATLMAEIQTNIDTLMLTIENLNAITNLTNAEINANPAATMKDVAREAKTIARQTVRIAKVFVGDLDDTDSGS